VPALLTFLRSAHGSSPHGDHVSAAPATWLVLNFDGADQPGRRSSGSASHEDAGVENCAELAARHGRSAKGAGRRHERSPSPSSPIGSPPIIVPKSRATPRRHPNCPGARTVPPRRLEETNVGNAGAKSFGGNPTRSWRLQRAGRVQALPGRGSGHIASPRAAGKGAGKLLGLEVGVVDSKYPRLGGRS
jgi:hypothetical protein